MNDTTRPAMPPEVAPADARLAATRASFRQIAAQFAAPADAAIAALWRHFETLCTTPRQSKREDALRDKIVAWATARALSCQVDAAGNLIIRKPASAGAEALPGVILQGHLDMVCQANADFAHDFARDAVPTTLRDGWLVAEHTTLGADNGIGVALALAALEADDISHPALEVLLTVDEEEGMGGALGLSPDTLTGRVLLNLDTEEWGEFYIGCAGGLDVDVQRAVQREPLPAGYSRARLCIDGLVGGHSGVDIHLGRGNANKLLARALCALERALPLRLAALAGGSARNAIPREAWADIAFPLAQERALHAQVSALEATLRSEFSSTDAQLRLALRAAGEATDATDASVVTLADQRAVLHALHAAPVGVRRMSADVAGVVESSNNLGTMRLAADGFHANCMVRSLVDTASDALAEEIASGFRLAGCTVRLGAHYPSWRPDPVSPLLATCRAVYQREFAAQHGPSRVQVIHAGLECGIIGKHYPALQMVSFGPTIRGAHAPGERVELAAVTQCWHLLRAILAELARGETPV